MSQKKTKFGIYFGALFAVGSVVAVIFTSTRQMGFQLEVFERFDIEFDGTETDAVITRPGLVSKTRPVTSKNQVHFRDVYLKLADWTPSWLEPRMLRVYIEKEARVTFADGQTETIPISIVASRQNVIENSITMGQGNPTPTSLCSQTVFTHEVGHMFVEWAYQDGPKSKKEAKFPWSRSIYEGVSDFLAAALMGSTYPGGKGCFGRRNILRDQSIQEAEGEQLTGIQWAERDMERFDLNLYRSYRNLMASIPQDLMDTPHPHPYRVGAWMAGQIWKLSKNNERSEIIFKEILNLARIGKRYSSPQIFLNDLRTRVRQLGDK